MLHIREKAIKELRSLPLRTYDVHVHGSTSAHEPPHFEEVPALYSNYLTWLNTEIEKVQATDREGGVLRFAAEAHTKLVKAHVWGDGNGRTARAVTNIVLKHCQQHQVLFETVPRPEYMRAFGGEVFWLFSSLCFCCCSSLLYRLQCFRQNCMANVATFAQFLGHYQAITPPPRYIVVNQSEEDALRFNRAALINIGALEAERVGCDYMPIHDVDMVKAHFVATAMDAALAQL
ncbi:hypothetical protein niasHT_014639 [Heterodera trifolii]|uniref:Fido domain-containing protein n=1 Tax=Heterodera trifolii TaxID=157864 RepID=A0ABD2LHX3_9BILA